MEKSIQDVMTPDPAICQATASVAEAATLMRDRDIGDVLVEKDGRLYGLVTDRDIVVRALAAGADPRTTLLADICTRELTIISPRDPASGAMHVMREKALRRLPVVANGKAVGIVSLGDLAIEQDRDSALAHISAAPPNT